MGLKKKAATACVTTSADGNLFKATLNGHSIEWGGRYYTVSDTLIARINVSPVTFKVREDVVYKMGWYTKPTVSEAASGFYNFSNPALYRNTAGQGLLDASQETMEAVDITTDMLALFYIYRNVSFDSIEQGREYMMTVRQPDGTRQHLIFRYTGESNYTINGMAYPTYDTEFQYYFNGRPSGYTVKCQVERQSRIPLVFSGKLIIGHVSMIYNPD